MNATTRTLSQRCRGWLLILGFLLVCRPSIGEPTQIPKPWTKVQYSNEFCTYQDKIPFVKSVNWDHPLIKESKKSFAQVSKGMFTYGEWKLPYGLESDWSRYSNEYAHASEARKKEIDALLVDVNFRNFIRVLCGEHRDYPHMIRKKLEVCARRMPVVPKGMQKEPDPADPEIWKHFTGEGYMRLRHIMDEVYNDRLQQKNPNPPYPPHNYNFGEPGHGSNRVDNSVAPFTHAEMRYVFHKYLHKKSVAYNHADFEKGLQEFVQTYCNPSPDGPDLGYMYNFRGHKNFQPLWLDCNGFIWLSRDAGQMLQNQVKPGETPDVRYYRRPFATRYTKGKGCMGAYTFYRDEDHKHFRKASESGGGPHLYIEPIDRNNDGVSDYRLFANVMGSGDLGLESQALPVSRMKEVEPCQKTTARFSAWRFKNYKDWGFFHSFQTFDERMARLNQALDRHTNWGPTHMFNPEVARYGDYGAIRGAYSPIVACSYVIDASHGFAVGDYPNTHPDEQGRTKWMYVMKFRARDYYDEVKLKKGERIDWDRAYFNETSLSNDYYTERALDRFGWVPASDIDANLYMVEAGGEGYYYDDDPWAFSDDEGDPETGGGGIIPALDGADDSD